MVVDGQPLFERHCVGNLCPSQLPKHQNAWTLRLIVDAFVAIGMAGDGEVGGSIVAADTSSTCCDGPIDTVAITFAPPRGWKAVGMALEEVAMAFGAIGRVSGDGGGGGSVVAASADVSGGRYALCPVA